jgi:hypothetical protein
MAWLGYVLHGVNETGRPLPVMRAAAIVGLVVGSFLLLGSWDGLYDALDLPQGLPAMSAQLGGISLVALAYLLWSASPRPELARVAAVTGLIAEGGAALIIAGWLILRDPSDDLGIDTLGTVILIVIAAILAALAVGLARIAFGQSRAE